MSAALIGDSILEFIDETVAIKTEPHSVLHSLIGNEGNVLVQGPYATSLAMNTACAIASYCQCRLVSCHCVAVTFLTLRKKSFPLFCQEAPQSSDDLEDKLRILENATPTWNFRALKRIQVVRFQSARNLISYLLNLHAKQPRQRPWRALMVDGLDQFITDGNEKATSIRPEGVVRMTQICKFTVGQWFDHLGLSTHSFSSGTFGGNGQNARAYGERFPICHGDDEIDYPIEYRAYRSELVSTCSYGRAALRQTPLVSSER